MLPEEGWIPGPVRIVRSFVCELFLEMNSVISSDVNHGVVAPCTMSAPVQQRQDMSWELENQQKQKCCGDLGVHAEHMRAGEVLHA